MKDRARSFLDRAAWRGFRVIDLRWMVRIALFGAVAGLNAGCALTVPMSGTTLDDAPTGSIKAPGHPSPFSPQMDAEDWRRAKSALDTALDPQGNGASVAWENPRSGAKGSFVPLGQVYPRGDGICRPFAARTAMKGETETMQHSSACRVNSGDWVVGRVEAGPAPKGASAKTSDKLAERDTRTQLR